MWVDFSGLPAPFDDRMGFFRAALQHKVPLDSCLRSDGVQTGNSLSSLLIATVGAAKPSTSTSYVYGNVMQPSAVIFDLDGTLIDSAGDLQRAVNRMLEEFGCAPIPLSEFRRMLGDGAEVLIARALAARQCAPQNPAAALGLFLEHYEADLTTLTRPYPGAQETLGILRARGLKLAVCTNKPTGLTRVILERLGLDRYFTRVLGGDSLPFCKPDPRVLFELLATLQAPAASSLLVGDSEVDAATASAADVPFVLMTHGYHRGPVGAIPCVASLDSFEQLTQFLG